MTKLKEDFEASGGVWKEWKMGDLFVFSAIKQAKSQALIPENHQGVPYIIQSTKNNMYKMHVDEQWLIENGENPVKGNAIVLGVTLPAVSYQPYKFGASQVITARSEFLNEYVGSYIVSILKKYIELFSYNAKPGMQIYKDMQVILPTLNNSLALDYMEQYITLLEEERMIQVDKFLKDSGLNDTTLTAEEISALEKFRNGEMKFVERKIGELFDIHPTKAYKMTNPDLFKNKGDIPVVTNSSVENGITGYVDLKPTEKGGVVTYSDTTTDEGIFYQPYDFVGYSHVQGVYPLDVNNWRENNLIYFVSLFKKSAKGRFDYASKFNRAIAKEMFISLPINVSNDIDYTFMQHFISALEKLIIKGVVKYKDEVLNS